MRYNINTKIQKKRNLSNSYSWNINNNNYKNHNILLCLKKKTSLEIYFFFFLKKILKYFYKKNNALANIFFFWIFLKLNFPITKKSKNSRMGKGKGAFLRYALKVSRYNTIVLKIKTINSLRILYLFKLLKKSIFHNIFLILV